MRLRVEPVTQTTHRAPHPLAREPYNPQKIDDVAQRVNVAGLARIHPILFINYRSLILPPRPILNGLRYVRGLDALHAC